MSVGTIREDKPGWLSRIFQIETAALIACDAKKGSEQWERGESFKFLYRSRRGKYFLLEAIRDWSILPESKARELYQELPEKLQDADVFDLAPELEDLPRPSRDEDEDTRSYKVVRNDKWEFSIWLDYKDLPSGWFHIGMSGKKVPCLDFIRQHCVFGAENPGLPNIQ